MKSSSPLVKERSSRINIFEEFGVAISSCEEVEENLKRSVMSKR